MSNDGDPILNRNMIDRYSPEGSEPKVRQRL